MSRWDHKYWHKPEMECPYTIEQLMLVSKALNTYVVCMGLVYKDKEVDVFFEMSTILKEYPLLQNYGYLLSPEGSDIVKDFLIAQGFYQFLFFYSLANCWVLRLEHDDIISKRYEGETFSEVFLAACIDYLEQKDKR